MGERADGFVENNTALVEDFLKLSRSLAAPVRSQIRFPAHIDGIQSSGQEGGTAAR